MSHKKSKIKMNKKGIEWETIGKMLLVLLMFFVILAVFMLLTNKSLNLLDFIFG